MKRKFVGEIHWIDEQEMLDLIALASLRLAVVALIASAGLSNLNMVVFGSAEIRLENVDWVGPALFAAAFIALRKLKREPILVMVCCGANRLFLNLLFGL